MSSPKNTQTAGHRERATRTAQAHATVLHARHSSSHESTTGTHSPLIHSLTSRTERSATQHGAQCDTARVQLCLSNKLVSGCQGSRSFAPSLLVAPPLRCALQRLAGRGLSREARLGHVHGLMHVYGAEHVFYDGMRLHHRFLRLPLRLCRAGTAKVALSLSVVSGVLLCSSANVTVVAVVSVVSDRTLGSVLRRG